jgi:thiol-disulfide isomerase/thioredoxin
MMYLVVGVAALCLFNLVVTMGVVRRLLAITKQLPPKGMHPAARNDKLLPVGTVVGDFAAPTVDGDVVSRQVLTGETLVAFMSPGCPPCDQLLPVFIRRARVHPGGRQRVIAVLTGARPEESPHYVAQLTDVAQVVVEDDRGPLSDAFRADSFPALYMVDADGRVLAAGAGSTATDELPTAVTAHVG